MKETYEKYDAQKIKEEYIKTLTNKINIILNKIEKDIKIKNIINKEIYQKGDIYD